MTSTCELDHPAHRFELVPCGDIVIKHGSFRIIDACDGCALFDGAHALLVVDHCPAQRSQIKCEAENWLLILFTAMASREFLQVGLV